MIPRCYEIFLASPFLSLSAPISNNPARYSRFFPFIRRNLKIDRFHLLSSRSTDGIVAEPIIRTARRVSLAYLLLCPCPIPSIYVCTPPPFYLSIYLPATLSCAAQLNPLSSRRVWASRSARNSSRNRNGDNARA